MKWIAIDFGTRRIKLLKFAIEGQKVDIEAFEALESRPDFFRGLAFPEPAAWTAVTIALNELDWIKADEETMIITGLPSAYLETRYLRFPFRSDKQIEKVLQFELESMIPFDIEEVQIRNQVLSGDGVSVGKKDSLIQAYAYKRSLIKQVEVELKKFQISMPPITSHILALSSLRQFLTEHPVYMILELGHAQSHLLLMQRSGEILGSRTIWWGGKNLIEAIQEEMRLDPPKAEHQLIHMDPSKPPTRAMQTSLKHFTTEVRQGLKSFLASGLQLPKPLPIYVFGRVSHYVSAMAQVEEGLNAEFSAKFKPFPFGALKTKSLQGLTKLNDIEMALPALSIALAQTKNHRAKIPTFSESSFQFQQNLKKLRSGSFSLIKNIALLLIAPFLYSGIQIFVQTKDNRLLLNGLPQLVSNTSINYDPKMTTDDIVKSLKKELSTNRSKIEQIPTDESPLDGLASLSKAIPNHLKIDIRDLKITNSTISFSAETKSQEMATSIVEALQRSFPKVKTGATTNCSNNTKTDCRLFKVEIERNKPS